jgi:hypothetical protein
MVESDSIISVNEFLKNTFDAWSSGKLNQIHINFQKEANKKGLEEFKNSYIEKLEYFDMNYKIMRGEFLINIGTEDNRMWCILTNYRLIIMDLFGKYSIIPLYNISSYRSSGILHKKINIKLKDNNTIELNKLYHCPYDGTVNILTNIKDWKQLSDFELELLLLNKVEVEEKLKEKQKEKDGDKKESKPSDSDDKGVKHSQLDEIKQMLKDRKSLDDIEAKILLWKHRGYNVEELEKMLEEVKNE